MNKFFFREYFENIYSKLKMQEDIALFNLVERINICKLENKKIILVGNGGSSAIASHVAVDFTKVIKIRAVNFNESNLITCFANDYGYENWVVEALKAYADQGDLLILISSSGNSLNLINAAKEGKVLGLNIVTFTGFHRDNPLGSMGDLNYWVDSKAYNIVETVHQSWLLSVVDYMADNRLIGV